MQLQWYVLTSFVGFLKPSTLYMFLYVFRFIV